MKAIALIPARSGSKRLPGKNLMKLNGKPLLWYSIQAGMMANGISETYISSDDISIGELASGWGVEFLRRPNHLSTDTSSTADVLIHTALALNLSDEDVIVTLQPTNPLRPMNLIDEILTFAKKSALNWTSLSTVTQVKTKFGKLYNGLYFPHNYVQGQRSQDMEELFFYENGLVYLTKVGPLLKSGCMFGDRVLGYKTACEFSEIDIDTLADFKLAELIYSECKNKYKLV